jgi:hypothetical protein
MAGPEIQADEEQGLGHDEGAHHRVDDTGRGLGAALWNCSKVTECPAFSKAKRRLIGALRFPNQFECK